ncbi:hypothetical protein M0R45_016643 [Rubus argutus]|uniref:Uncharacterized protein n=1 Tax=Rubus argutus TaxID=59490 RepID=A0AAW1XTZ2_RUBAR
MPKPPLIQASMSGCPIELVEHEILCFACVDIRIHVKEGGITRALVAYYQKYLDEQAKKEIKDLVADLKRC